jgi:hypothetical protein
LFVDTVGARQPACLLVPKSEIFSAGSRPMITRPLFFDSIATISRLSHSSLVLSSSSPCCRLLAINRFRILHHVIFRLHHHYPTHIFQNLRLPPLAFFYIRLRFHLHPFNPPFFPLRIRHHSSFCHVLLYTSHLSCCPHTHFHLIPFIFFISLIIMCTCIIPSKLIRRHS